MGASTVIGLDIGTTSVKAAAYDREGRKVAAAEQEYPLHSSGPRRVEQDPDELLAGVGTVLKQVAAQVGDRRIAGVALSSAMHTLLALDAAGQPLTPVATYADNRAGAEAEALRRSDGLPSTGGPARRCTRCPRSPSCSGSAPTSRRYGARPIAGGAADRTAHPAARSSSGVPTHP